jgi:F-type H+-transporting ATPase subunit b
MIELFLLIALIVFFILIWKPFKEKVLGGLDARSERIRQELDEAQRLHEEAKAMLAKYQRQLHEGENLAKEIVQQAEAERRRLEAKMQQDLALMIERRTQQAEERIAQEEQRALQEVRARAADLSVRATRDILTSKLKGDEVQKVMSGAIEEVSKKLA